MKKNLLEKYLCEGKAKPDIVEFNSKKKQVTLASTEKTNLSDLEILFQREFNQYKDWVWSGKGKTGFGYFTIKFNFDPEEFDSTNLHVSSPFHGGEDVKFPSKDDIRKWALKYFVNDFDTNVVYDNNKVLKR